MCNNKLFIQSCGDVTSVLRQNLFKTLLEDCFYRAEPLSRSVYQETPN